MSLPSDHGVIQLTKMLDSLDGKTIRIKAETRGTSRESEADFDRRVRQAMDRAHRRAVIGQS